ncbi:CU044_2847 family protein [Streptomyces sp. NPDC047315]|uniref:CU044_2847 family protein n=1 Tax=Streptomyces sp. NPDC047315 TaxID=3155142 RepID=UPI0033E12FC0
MATEVVSYALDDETVVRFEIEPTDHFHRVSSDDVVSRVRDAVRPAVQAARTVLDGASELRPEEVTVTFGIKVSGTANWLVAKAASEGNFEVSLVWRPTRPTAADAPADGTTVTGGSTGADGGPGADGS